MNIKLVKSDYLNSQHEEDILMLMDAYSSDPMGGGQALADEVIFKSCIVNFIKK